MVPDLPDAVSKRVEDVTQDLQTQTTKLSTNATHRVADRAGHAVHQDEPERVVEVIRGVLEKVKPRPSS